MLELLGPEGGRLHPKGVLLERSGNQLAANWGINGVVFGDMFVSAIVLRPQRRHLGLGLDSWVALVIYAPGVWGLLVVSG